MAAAQLPSAMCQAGPHSACSAEGHDLNSNLLSSTKNNCAENAVLYFFIYFCFMSVIL